MASIPYFKESAHFFSENGEYLEALYETYLQDPQQCEEPWRTFFSTMGESESHQLIRQHTAAALQKPYFVNEGGASRDVFDCYRQHAFRYAATNPLAHASNEKEQHAAVLSHSEHLNISDLKQAPAQCSLPAGVSYQDYLHRIFLGSIGFEYGHILRQDERHWLDQAIMTFGENTVTEEVAKQAMEEVLCADQMERFLARNFVGKKRFGLEGAEALIPLINHMIACGAKEHTLKEARLGLAHRGRLSVMMNVLGMPFKTTYDKFTGQFVPKEDQSGDVQYHMGYSSDRCYGDQTVHLSLACNPSHLEFIGPVVMGTVRARQERTGYGKGIVPIIVHGDAAVAGQGVVAEMINMSRTAAHDVHGGVHIVLNNQIGFTTSRSEESRIGQYPTDIFHLFNGPIFHVNADDIPAVLFVARLAMAYRMTFGRSVAIELIGYRRFGHNEADDPSVTQPGMYQQIKQHTPVAKLFEQYCLEKNLCDQAWLTSMQQCIADKLTQGHQLVETMHEGVATQRAGLWKPFLHQSWDQPHTTSMSRQSLIDVGQQILQLPEGFEGAKQVKKLWSERQAMLDGEQGVRWGFAELLAYASLVHEGYRVRLNGQDAGRGTFSHRHAFVVDQQTDQRFCPFEMIAKDTARFDVYNSVLSEQSVLGFEYGYSLSHPMNLTVWEAQYGDFVNGAQVIIDQFISSGWQKWGLLSGVVMLLPHGYEGQGPEHTSARLERFLQLAAQHNIQVCVPSTAGQIFHLLRRQVIRQYRKPLVIMSPKSLLRHPEVTVSLEDMAKGSFELVISDARKIKPRQVKRVILCSGKIYYDLKQACEQYQLDHIALIRVEQLYPFPEHACREALAQFPKAATIVWCQEEPKNQGAWYALRHHFEACCQPKQSLLFVGRPMSAAPAVGYKSVHDKRQRAVIEEALELETIANH